MAPSIKKIVGTGEWRRILLWTSWMLNMLMNFIYLVLAFATCTNIVQAFGGLDIEFNNQAWHAPIAACAMGGVMVFVFNLFSCFILLRKSINKSGPGFGYGFIMAMCFVMAFFTLLCGLVTSGFTSTVQTELATLSKWSKYDTGAYIGTTIFSLICAFMYMVFFIVLVIFQGGIMKQTGLYDPAQDEKRKLEMMYMAAAQAQFQVQQPGVNGMQGPSI
mmetsp:Transcript_34639/g.62390  ORF Transcript_34639/g.62390 Transcript_34639/m.62390 type:complete len:218 (-) Transcript_34639:370-1023(-)